MQKQIASYFFQHKTCPLPGLGTLEVVQTTAETDFTNNQIAAPTSFIRFENKETATDGLVSYLAKTSGDESANVSHKLHSFCDEIKKEITRHSFFQLNSIGNFFVGSSGNISFKPEELPAAFIQPVFAQRVIHPDAEHQILVGDKETTNTVMTEFFTESPIVKDYWWIWAIVLGVIGLLLVGLYFTLLHGTSAFGNAIKI